MRSYDIRAKARAALSGKWVMAALIGLVASLLGGTGNGGLNFEFDAEAMDSIYAIAPEVATVLMGLMGIIGVFAFVYSIALLILGGVVKLGYCKYNLKIVDGHMGTMGDLFSQFDRFAQAFLLNLLTGLFIALWSILLVIPGIVAAYSYSMAPYILLEDPNCSAMDAIRRSKEMMKGHKGRLFTMELSFIGWILLSVLTLGIGNLFLTPYMNAATAVFYRNLQDQRRSSYEEPQYNPPEYNTYDTPQQ